MLMESACTWVLLPTADLEAKLGFAVLSEHSGKKIVWPFLLQAYEIFVVSVLPEKVACGLLFFTIYVLKMY